MLERVVPRDSALLTRNWLLAQAATWGRWVTHSTWWRSPSSRSSLPTTSATAPPTPLSTSSKIRVGTRAARLAMTDSASEIRDSSPPEATLASGRGVVPAWPATRNSTCSLPWADGAEAASTGSNLPPCMASVCIAWVTSLPRSLAVLRRAAVSFAAAASYCACAASAWARSASTSPAACSAESWVCSVSRSSHRASGSTRNFRAVSNTRLSRISTVSSRCGSSSTRLT
ncbi:hypothetical protein D9M72_187690 [compost metagenome]